MSDLDLEDMVSELKRRHTHPTMVSQQEFDEQVVINMLSNTCIYADTEYAIFFLDHTKKPIGFADAVVMAFNTPGAAFPYGSDIANLQSLLGYQVNESNVWMAFEIENINNNDGEVEQEVVLIRVIQVEE